MNKETQEKIDMLQAQIDEIREECKRESEYPDNLMDGYRVLGAGKIEGVNYLPYGKDCFDQGRWFETREEAEQFSDDEKLRTKILRRIKKLNDGWFPSWGTCNEHYNYMLYYNASIVSLEVECWTVEKRLPNAYYFKSRDIGNQLIEEFGLNLAVLFR